MRSGEDRLEQTGRIQGCGQREPVVPVSEQPVRRLEVTSADELSIHWQLHSLVDELLCSLCTSVHFTKFLVSPVYASNNYDNKMVRMFLNFACQQRQTTVNTNEQNDLDSTSTVDCLSD